MVILDACNGSGMCANEKTRAMRGSLFVKLWVLRQIANCHAFLALDGTSVRLICICSCTHQTELTMLLGNVACASIPDRRLNKELLPAPLGPTSASLSPLDTVKLRPSKRNRCPSCDFEISSTTSRGSTCFLFLLLVLDRGAEAVAAAARTTRCCRRCGFTLDAGGLPQGQR